MIGRAELQDMEQWRREWKSQVISHRTSFMIYVHIIGHQLRRQGRQCTPDGVALVFSETYLVLLPKSCFLFVEAQQGRSLSLFGDALA